MASQESEITDYFANARQLDAKDFPIGIGDDMAQMNFAPSSAALITTDMLLDGTHFDSSLHSLGEIAYKSMAVNLSDCAAMASVPFAAVVSVALPRGFSGDDLKEFHSGILKAGDMFGCSLIGGDITSWQDETGRLAVNIAMLSKRGNSDPVKRSTAQAGDIVCVTGDLGGSLSGSHLSFVPRVKEALRLTELAKINSMMDISDGLGSDIRHICRLSDVGAVLNAQAIPISSAAKASANPLESALCDGEDFELLFTVSPEEFEKLEEKWNLPVNITAIGKTTREKVVEIVDIDGNKKPLVAYGYDHLRGKD